MGRLSRRCSLLLLLTALVTGGLPPVAGQWVPGRMGETPTASATPAVKIPAGLHEAASRGNLARVQAILDANPRLIELTDRDGWTPLAYAARFGQAEMVRFLLKRKAKVNVRDLTGATPLHHAAAFGMDATVRLLLKAGADINALSTGHMTPRGLAKSGGYSDLADYLGDHGGH